MTAKRLVVAALVALAAAPIFAATDVITVASVTATSSNVDVPVYIRDASTTPLGMDQPSGSKIESLSFKVTYAPASSIQSITFSRAGITANLTPTSEFTPSTAGTVSLVDAFNESTNLIPFTLDAAAPGNLVAHLTVTLSSSAPPGSTISLTLDPSVTQLANTGGTTKETTTNGALSLVNGQITVPNISITMSPNRLDLAPGGNGSLFVNASAPVPSATTLNVVSSDTTVAKVPATVTIPSGGQVVSIPVTAVNAGSARVTATLPASMGSGSAQAGVAVAVPTVCNTPDTPQISAPTGAEVGADYAVSWPAAANATEYLISESTDAAFTAPTTTTVTTTSATFNHATNNVTYYYRVQAHNRAGTCDVLSGYSNVVAVLVGHAPVTPALTHYLPVVGSTAGSNGSYFKTSVQLYNPKDSAISGKIIFHTQGATGSANDPSLAYSIGPGKTLAYTDLLPAMGVASGLGSADVVADATSPLPISVVRVYNDAGVNGTTGLAEDQMASTDALQTGDTAALLAPADVQHFRLNVGIRTLDQGVALAITVRDKDGNSVKTLTTSYPATYFTQPGSAAFLGGYALTGGETITVNVTSGSAFIYGSTTDNITNDPSVQIARKIE